MLVGEKQSQNDEGKGSFSPLKALALPFLGHTSAGWQSVAGPAGRHISFKERTEPRHEFGEHSRSASDMRHRPVSIRMQSNPVESDDKAVAQLNGTLGEENPAVRGSGWVVNQWSSVQGAEFDKMLDRLKSDITRIFRREPNWDRFAEDFRLIEPSGDVVQGLGPIKLTLGLIRKFRNRVAIKENVDVQFVYSGDRIFSGPRVKKVVEARWKVKLGLELLNIRGGVLKRGCREGSLRS